jgi:hypothetical protein
MMAIDSSKTLVGFSRARSAVRALSRWMWGSTNDGVVRRPAASTSSAAPAVMRGAIDAAAGDADVGEVVAVAKPRVLDDQVHRLTSATQWRVWGLSRG